MVKLLRDAFVAALVLTIPPADAVAQDRADASKPMCIKHDGQRDFDFEIGTWNTHLRRLQKPLTGSTTWLEYRGTTIVRKVLGGCANLVELSVEGPAGRIDALSLRLYNPETRQWSLNFSNMAAGELAVPVIGGFKDGRGEFFSNETFNGRDIRVWFVISKIDPNTIRFEQSFSGDGGATWELNWVAVDTRQ